MQKAVKAVLAPHWPGKFLRIVINDIYIDNHGNNLKIPFGSFFHLLGQSPGIYPGGAFMNLKDDFVMDTTDKLGFHCIKVIRETCHSTFNDICGYPLQERITIEDGLGVFW
jgi:hypothetical protein